MGNQGQPKTPGQKRLLVNWGGSMLGVIIGGLGGDLVFGHTINNPPLAALLGTFLGAAIGFGAPDLVKLVFGHKAQ
jgi:hypothetical protein